MGSCNCIEPQWPADDMLVKYQYISDFFIAVGEYSIPLELIYFVKKSAVFPYKWVLVQFGFFIVLSANTHLINLWMFDVHTRKIEVAQTIAKVLCAVVSCVTAFMLVHIIPDLLSVKTRELFLKNKAEELDREMGLIRAQEETGRQVRMLSHEIRSTLDKHTILKITLVELGRTLSLEECALWMPTDNGLELQLCYSLFQENPVGFTINTQLPAIDHVLRTNHAVKISPNCPVARIRPVTGNYRPGEAVAMRVPLLHFQTKDWSEMSPKCYAMMVLILPSDTARQWHCHELELVEVVADQVAVALSHAAILEESMRSHEQLMEQNAALDMAKREAETAISARNDFLAVMNHEMRTPMYAIVALLSLLQETELTPEQRQMMETILRCSNHLAALISDVFDLSKVEDGSLKLDSETFDLHAVFREVLSLIKPIASVKKLYISLHVAHHIPEFAVGDEKRLMQILLNIVGNAVKFSKEGSISITATLAKSEPRLPDFAPVLTDNQFHLRVQVKDSGTGINPQDISKLFSKFAHSQTVAEGSGNGLGLAVCKRFVNLMDGNIWIESDGLDKGCTATFIVKLGLPDQNLNENKLAVLPNLPANRSQTYFPGLRALVMDANGISRTVTRGLLMHLGFEVTTVSTGEECLIRVSPEYKLVVSDVSNPGVDSYEIALQIHKRFSKSKERPLLVALTAMADITTRENCMRADIDGFLLKPVSVDNMRSLLSELLDQIDRGIEGHQQWLDDEFVASSSLAPPISPSNLIIISSIIRSSPCLDIGKKRKGEEVVTGGDKKEEGIKCPNYDMRRSSQKPKIKMASWANTGKIWNRLAMLTYEDFVEVHGLLLAASGLPGNLYRRLYEKLSSETFDGGSFFQIEPCEEGRQRRLVCTADFVAKNSNVFLIDHAWTFRLSDAPKQLEEIPGLAERMASLMCVDMNEDVEDIADNVNDDGNEMSVEQILEADIQKARNEGHDSVKWLELEGLDIDDTKLMTLDLPGKFPSLIALSLYGNKIRDVETILDEISKFKHLKALWLNDNPVVAKCKELGEETIVQAFPELEIFNSSFTTNYGEWALGFCGGIYGKDNPVDELQNEHPLKSLTHLDLSNRGIHNIVNKHFSTFKIPLLSHVNLRGNPLDEISDTELMEVMKSFPSLTSLEVDIPGPLGDNALEILETVPNIFLLNGVKASKIYETDKYVVDSRLKPRFPAWNPEDSLVERVLSAMWLYLMNYRLADEEKIDETSVWYVMDELGSALRHSDEPNFLVSPFLYMPDGKLSSAVSYSICWQTQDVHQGDECTRDYLLGIGEDKQRSARLTAWFHTPENYFLKAYEKRIQNLKPSCITSSSVISDVSGISSRSENPIRVYTDLPYVQEFLTRPEFSVTNEPKEADIVWTSMQVDEETKKAVGINDDQYINQFPFEACIVMKHHLAETIQKAYGSPRWFQPTYDLEKHLAELIGDYYVRERDGLDNLWILKPWNMARTIDTTISSNLSAIIRLIETGPKICQKYIERPALFRGKKFDLRYIVLVRSLAPMDLFLSDVFWVRLSNNQYTLDKRSLYEYETHFTVMNYRGKLNHIHTSEFVQEFEVDHRVKWLDIHQRIRSMIRSVFEAAVGVHPEMQSPKSRAIYGVDVMLDSSFNPKLLEVTYCPDCTRACTYDMTSFLGGGGEIKGRDFFNDVFGCLFLDETKNVTPL
ncbi:hypothetical protein V2J09_012864 [Rumex salicifolius]